MDIYPCDFCGGLHLGHTTLKYAAHCERERKAKISRILDKIRKHERVISQHVAIIHRLRDQLESVIISYSASEIDPQHSD